MEYLVNEQKKQSKYLKKTEDYLKTELLGRILGAGFLKVQKCSELKGQGILL